jgi:hypothetical protein
VQNKYFDELLAAFPQVQRDRYGLTFSQSAGASQAARTLSEAGVVMLKDALPANALPDCRESFERFTRSLSDETESGSWHSPWRVQDDAMCPAAVVLGRLLRSWAWNVVEEFCGSTDIAVLLAFCVARHAIDKRLGAGAHQDARGLPPELPFSLWVPLHAVTPLQTSGLGFLPPSPDRLLPALPNNDVGPEYVLDHFAKAWVPSYAPGDVTLHSSLLPHFTTGYGTGSDRYSVEIRAMAAGEADPKLQDPALYVARRHGRPTIVGTRCSPGVDAGAFFNALSARFGEVPKS